MKKIVLIFGLIAGAILSVMMVITIPLANGVDSDRGLIIGYATMVAAFMMVFFGVRSYRDNVAGGSITFGRAFGVGLLIMLIASTCYVGTWEVLYFKIWPDFGDRYAARTIEKARANGATPAQLAETQKKMDDFKRMYRNPAINIALTFLEPLPVGLVFTLVSAGLLRRRKNAGTTPAAEALGSA